MAQKTVKTKLAFGVQGEFYDSSVKRVTPHVLKTAAVIGGAAWVDSNGKASSTGGASGEKFVGIFVSPKEYINRGSVDTATLALATGDVAQVADIGHVIVKLATGATAGVGDTVYFGPSGWANSAANAGDATNATGPKGAIFVRVTAGTGGEMAVVELNG